VLWRVRVKVAGEEAAQLDGGHWQRSSSPWSAGLADLVERHGTGLQPDACVARMSRTPAIGEVKPPRPFAASR
jgi:hypothetical protein